MLLDSKDKRVVEMVDQVFLDGEEITQKVYAFDVEKGYARCFVVDKHFYRIWDPGTESVKTETLRGEVTWTAKTSVPENLRAGLTE